MQAYSDPKRESDPHTLPDVEVFEVKADHFVEEWGESALDLEPGFYYWYCFPGCLPDSDPVGPFQTEQEALADAQEGSEG